MKRHLIKSIVILMISTSFSSFAGETISIEDKVALFVTDRIDASNRDLQCTKAINQCSFKVQKARYSADGSTLYLFATEDITQKVFRRSGVEKLARVLATSRYKFKRYASVIIKHPCPGQVCRAAKRFHVKLKLDAIEKSYVSKWARTRFPQ